MYPWVWARHAVDGGETDLIVNRVQGTRYKPIKGEIVSIMIRYIYRDDCVLDSAVSCKAGPFYVSAYLERVNPDDLRRSRRRAGNAGRL